MSDKNDGLKVDLRKILDTVAEAEGFSPKPYLDPVGKLTIGYGWNLEGRPVDKLLGKTILLYQLTQDWQKLHVALPWVFNLSEVRRLVLTEMCFNLGLTGLLGFKNTLGLVQQGKYAEAATAMLQSRWAGQVKGRAIRLARSMETNTWPGLT